jgi:lysophospholipase L1-like esterase
MKLGKPRRLVRSGAVWRRASILCALATAACGATAPASRPPADEGWVATWATAPQLTEDRNMPPAPGLAGNTLRQALRVSIGGSRLRVRWSNEYGGSAMVIRAARLARFDGAGAVDPATEQALTFDGQPGVTMAAGQVAVSDPLDFELEAMADLALTVWFGDVPGELTGHPGSRTTSWIQPGNAVSAPSMATGVETEHWYAMTGIDVVAPDAAAVAILGNSITDGRGSTTNGNDRWPDVLSRRLRGDPATHRVAVLNLGTGGNCVLRACLGPAGVARYQRDILDQPGVRWAIVLEGVNDIGGVQGAAASDSVANALIAAYQRMIDQAHARGLRIYGATILPFAGSFYASPEREAARTTVNEWIRISGAFDAVIDFDAALRDPSDPTRLRPDADTGDHLHPDAEGYRLMGEAVDLSLFRVP